MDEQKLIAFFKDLHAHPEVSGSEFRTTAKLREALEAAGVRILPSGLQTGLVAEVGGQRPGRVIGLRCDIDALRADKNLDGKVEGVQEVLVGVFYGFAFGFRHEVEVDGFTGDYGTEGTVFHDYHRIAKLGED